jgi:hypothetical protein
MVIAASSPCTGGRAPRRRRAPTLAAFALLIALSPSLMDSNKLHHSCALSGSKELSPTLPRGLVGSAAQAASGTRALPPRICTAAGGCAGTVLSSSARLRLRGGSGSAPPPHSTPYAAGPPMGAMRPGIPAIPQNSNIPSRPAPISSSMAAGPPGAGGNLGGPSATAVLDLGKNSTAHRGAFELLLNERDEGVRTSILQQLDLALRTSGVADSLLLSDWKTFCARLLAVAGQRGTASASAELKALHNTCTTLYAWSDPNGPGGLKWHCKAGCSWSGR